MHAVATSVDPPHSGRLAATQIRKALALLQPMTDAGQQGATVPYAASGCDSAVEVDGAPSVPSSTVTVGDLRGHSDPSNATPHTTLLLSGSVADNSPSAGTSMVAQPVGAASLSDDGAHDGEDRSSDGRGGKCRYIPINRFPNKSVSTIALKTFKSEIPCGCLSSSSLFHCRYF